jgi:hypothetical protein
MFNVATKIDTGGFWYLLEANCKMSFSFQYFALGSQGNFCSGEIEGIMTPSSDWQFCKIKFPILHVGITNLEISETPNKGAVNKPSADNKVKKPVDISRRKMINQTIAALFLGGTVLPTLFEQSASAKEKELSSYSPYDSRLAQEDNQTRYSPYGQENYSPY